VTDASRRDRAGADTGCVGRAAGGPWRSAHERSLETRVAALVIGLLLPTAVGAQVIPGVLATHLPVDVVLPVMDADQTHSTAHAAPPSWSRTFHLPPRAPDRQWPDRVIRYAGLTLEGLPQLVYPAQTRRPDAPRPPCTGRVSPGPGAHGSRQRGWETLREGSTDHLDRRGFADAALRWAIATGAGLDRWERALASAWGRPIAVAPPRDRRIRQRLTRVETQQVGELPPDAAQGHRHFGLRAPWGEVWGTQ